MELKQETQITENMFVPTMDFYKDLIKNTPRKIKQNEQNTIIAENQSPTKKIKLTEDKQIIIPQKTYENKTENKQDKSKSVQEKKQEKLIQFLVLTTKCSEQLAKSAIQKFEELEQARKYVQNVLLQEIEKKDVNQQIFLEKQVSNEPKLEKQEEISEDKNDQIDELVQNLMAVTGCSQKQAQDILKSTNNDFELAEKQILSLEKDAKLDEKITKQKDDKIEKSIIQNEEIKFYRQDKKSISLMVQKLGITEEKAENILVAAGGDIKLAAQLYQYEQDVQYKISISMPMDYHLPDHNVTKEQEDILMSLVGCYRYVAKDALNLLNGNMTVCENFLKQAIDFCRGDQEQALRLLNCDLLELGALNKLKRCQLKAIDFIGTKAQRSSVRKMPQLVKKFKKLGFDELDLETTLKYIRDEAPIIIHFNISRVLKYFVNDTHYRNQFETAMSGGMLGNQTRKQWEDELFGRAYHDANGFDRCKYGVLNILKDINGVKSCAAYGRSYFVLKEVRLRTTFSSQDSGGLANKDLIDDNLATCQHYAHILCTYNDNELRDVIEVAKGMHPAGKDSISIANYKEVQIHGEVKFDTHIQYMFYSEQEFNLNGEYGHINRFAPPPRHKSKKVIQPKEQIDAEDKYQQLELFKVLFPKIEVFKIEDFI